METVCAFGLLRVRTGALISIKTSEVRGTTIAYSSSEDISQRTFLSEGMKQHSRCVISGFLHDINEICALQVYYAALSSSSVPTLRNNLSVASSRVKRSASFIY